MNVQDLRNRYISIKSTVSNLKKQLIEKESFIKSTESEIDDLIQARYVITTVQENTQQYFKDQVEILTSDCLKSIYGDGFDFKLKAEIKRNRVEFQPIVIENGEEFSPREDQGGGVRNVCGLALRIVMMILNQSQRVVILDEPFKALGKLIDLAGKTLRSLSHDLGFQFIIITHDDRLAKYADKHFEITKINGISKVEVI